MDITEQCALDADLMFNQVRNGNIAAIEIFDSWGKPSSGVLEGDTEWFGKSDLCLGQAKNLKFNSFNYNYFLISFNLLSFHKF